MTVSILRPCPEHGPLGCVVCTECGHDRITEFGATVGDEACLAYHKSHKEHAEKVASAYSAAFEEVAAASGEPRAGRSTIEWGAAIAEKLRGMPLPEVSDD